MFVPRSLLRKPPGGDGSRSQVDDSGRQVDSCGLRVDGSGCQVGGSRPQGPRHAFRHLHEVLGYGVCIGEAAYGEGAAHGRAGGSSEESMPGREKSYYSATATDCHAATATACHAAMAHGAETAYDAAAAHSGAAAESGVGTRDGFCGVSNGVAAAHVQSPVDDETRTTQQEAVARGTGSGKSCAAAETLVAPPGAALLLATSIVPPERDAPVVPPPVSALQDAPAAPPLKDAPASPPVSDALAVPLVNTVPSLPVDSLAQPNDALATPKEALAEPKDALAAPKEALAEPKDALARPKDALAEPIDAPAEPPPDDLRVPDEAPVIARSFSQRAAAPGEPTCAACGRYGEYICDMTDDDVCSLECKAVVLQRAGLGQAAAEVLGKVGQCPAMRAEGVAFGEWITEEDAEWGPADLSPEQVEAIRRDLQIAVQGEDVPAPILAFSRCPLPPRLQVNLDAAGYETPTPVQMQVVPIALRHRDVLACARTGSGKTAAFLIPLLARVAAASGAAPAGHPLAIVLGPTRELCAQIEEAAKQLAQGLPNLRTALVVGGNPLPPQLHRLQQGAQVIVATPGRLIDLLARHDVPMGCVAMLVLDEVDVMLQLGFREQVEDITLALPSSRQTLMFSATIPPVIERLAMASLRRPVVVKVAQSSAGVVAVKQTVIWVENKDKKKKLFEILGDGRYHHLPLVVFVESKMGADLLAAAIRQVTGLVVLSVHGDKPMTERRDAVRRFLVGEVPVVVSTAVLGRGLDLVQVSQVIIFDMPQSLEEYVHQIGRAGRLGRAGRAMVFINNDSRKLLREFVAMLRESRVPIPKQLENSPFLHSEYAAHAGGRKRKAH